MYQTYNGGFIEVICGPMFASKTETLIARITSLQFANKTIRVFKPAIDNRYSEELIVSHKGTTQRTEVVKSSEDIFRSLISKMEKLPDVVVIDEVQFFDIGIVEVVEKLANMGIRVIVAGLDQDFTGKPFEVVSELLARAEIITKLSAVCVVCGAAATKSQRLIDGKPAKRNDKVVKVGASESYEARCRDCHIVDDTEE